MSKETEENKQSDLLVKPKSSGKVFAGLLQALFLSPKAVAELSHLSTDTVNNYLKNNAKPSAKELAQLSKGLKIPQKNLKGFFKPVKAVSKKHNFGYLLNHLRTKRGITMVELTKRSGVNQQTISRLERTFRLPYNKLIYSLAYGLRVAPSTFLARYFGYDKEPYPMFCIIRGRVLDNQLSNLQASKLCGIGIIKTVELQQGKRYPSPYELIKIARGLGMNMKLLFLESRYGLEYMSTMAFKIYLICVYHHCNVATVAKNLGVSHQSISNYINDTYKPSPRINKKIDRTVNKIKKEDM